VVKLLGVIALAIALSACTSTASSQPPAGAASTPASPTASGSAAPGSAPASASPSASPAATAGGALRVAADIDLGAPAAHGRPVAAEAPDGAVFFADGPVVMVVEGDKAPADAEHPGATVLGLGASASTLYVVTPQALIAYSRVTGDKTGRWALTGSPSTPTTAGVVVAANGDVWVWTDWATDFSGYEDAMLYVLPPGAAKPVVVSRAAEPGSVTTDGTHGYFVADGNSGASLMTATPAAGGSAGVGLQTVGPVPGESVIGFSRSQVVLYSQPDQLYTYAPGSGAPVVVKTHDALQPVLVAGTSSGLLFLTCAKQGCSTLVPVDQTTGASGKPASVPASGEILLGPDPVVVGVESGDLHLVRLG
jgi:hypothetical protein